MLKVSNGACVRRLGLRSMMAARTRNIVAVLAIALTTVLFTSLFSIAASLNASFQQQNFRQAGGDCHGTFKDLSFEQVEELRTDPLIEEGVARLFVGMPSQAPFNKSHVEVSYLEPAAAPHYFCVPREGRLPEEGTNEAATDTRVLALLGVEPELGAEFTVTFNIDEMTAHPKPVTRTFTLSGWWEYDSAVTASNILLPRSAAEEICALGSGEEDSMTGRWNLDVMLRSALHIERDLLEILERRGYQTEDAMGENYIATGVNWGYSGAQLSSSMDAGTLLAIGALLLLIVFTGYLIIYNIFQISVTNDIRFYGLLKTIGATGRQIKRIIRQQALVLSLTGIPIGLVLGFFAGIRLTPVILSVTDAKAAAVSFSPAIFAGSALFSLVTVFLSCAKPGRMAAKVSPVEAVRYTESGPARSGGRAKGRGTNSGASLPRMAWANLGRNRARTAVTAVSLTLAVVLATVTYTFATGFDMNKYLAHKADVDFILADAAYFNVSQAFRSVDEALPEEVISQVAERGGITESGRTYGQVSDIQQFVSEDWYRQGLARYNPPEAIDRAVANAVRNGDGLLMSSAQVYGMEDLPLDLLRVVEGDTAPLFDPNQNAIAAVMTVDDYNEVEPESHWAKVGDTVTLRYVREREYYFTDTGEIIEDFDAFWESQSNRPYASRPTVYEDRTYTVCALVVVPSSTGYRFYGVDQYVLNSEVFKRDSGTESVMYWCFNTTDEAEPEMEAFLAGYTENVQTLCGYEGRASYAAEFEGFRGMFSTMGGALSFLVGLVGVLNFMNAILTGILTRKREFAVLQSVGMTGKQLKTMLVCEGLYYTALSLLASLALTVALGPVIGGACEDIFWFFSYRLTLVPLLVVLPVFAALGALTPLAVYRWAERATIVERLREAEG